MASCADRLHRIQKSVGLTKEELRQAVRDLSRPREVKLPEFHAEPTREDKLYSNYNVSDKRRKRMIAHWYLEKYLKPKYANEIYMRFPEFKDLVNYAYDQAMALVQLATLTIEELEPDDLIPRDPEDEFDIPEIQWKEFQEYCRKHPLDGAGDVLARREKFKKRRQKRRNKHYSRKRMMMYDPLFASTVVDEEEMMKNFERISRENEERCREFHKMLDSLIPDKSVGSAMLERFDKQTQEIMARQKARMKQFMRERGQTPTTVAFSIDDSPTFSG